MLADLFRRPDQNVTSLAARLGVTLPVASRYLRDLNARGLLQARRTGSWVYYRPEPDRTIRDSARLCRALAQTLAPDPRAVENVYRAVTALTQARRLAIVRALGSTERSLASLRTATRLDARVLSRHVRKLERHGFVEVRANMCRLASPPSVLHATLLDLARRG